MSTTATTAGAAAIESRSSRDRRFVERYGPWAVVTGASAGIGEAIARRLASRGVDLVLVARNADRIELLADELAAAHDVDVVAVPLDLAISGSVERLAAATSELDVGLLVAAAGFGTSGPFVGNRVDDELEMIEVNCSAVCAQAHHFATRFAERGSGGLILLSSIVAFQGMPMAANYAATKAYIQTLGEGLERELRGSGVDVLTAAPGPTASGFAARAGMQMSGADTPERIAGPILDALGRRPTVLPSARSKLLRWAVLTMPRRRGRVWIMGNVMKGMTRHRTS